MFDGRTSDTREALMQLLLVHREQGATLDELAQTLNISRNAVRQHITAMERDGLVESVAMRRTSRRPSRAYGLTASGGEKFPRQYDLLALETLEAVHETLGEDAAESVLDAMVQRLVEPWLPELQSLDDEARRQRVAEVMNQLGYHAKPTGEGVEAINCVFHRVARETRVVCRFDEKLLSRLLGTPVLLTNCMAEGDGSCAFSRLASESRASDRRRD